MQIIQTEVATAISLAGHPVLRVRFNGEGGECVTVDMASADADEAAAIERAKAILVQTATFDSASNEYHARSNGNFDEVDVTSASDETGRVYIFEVTTGKAAGISSRVRAQSGGRAGRGDQLRDRSPRRPAARTG